ncbi:MAG: hypothetical protein QOJ06_1062 [Pseudonocardiales bacterium]|nr:hypothetical protein [Pseudonocardiales bacterium]
MPLQPSPIAETSRPRPRGPGNAGARKVPSRAIGAVQHLAWSLPLADPRHDDTPCPLSRSVTGPGLCDGPYPRWRILGARQGEASLATGLRSGKPAKSRRGVKLSVSRRYQSQGPRSQSLRRWLQPRAGQRVPLGHRHQVFCSSTQEHRNGTDPAEGQVWCSE